MLGKMRKSKENEKGRKEKDVSGMKGKERGEEENRSERNYER